MTSMETRISTQVAAQFQQFQSQIVAQRAEDRGELRAFQLQFQAHTAQQTLARELQDQRDARLQILVEELLRERGVRKAATEDDI